MIDLSKLQTQAKKVVATNTTAPAQPVLNSAPMQKEAPVQNTAPAFGNSALDSLLSQAGETEFKDVDPGTYIAQITKCEMGKTKAESKDMFVLTMKVADGDATGQYISQYRVLTKKDGSVNGFNIRLMKEWLTTMTGATPTNGAELLQLCKHVNDTKPMVQVTITHDTWGDNRVSVNVSKLTLLA